MLSAYKDKQKSLSGQILNLPKFLKLNLCNINIHATSSVHVVYLFIVSEMFL